MSNKVSDTILIKQDGESRELFMSFGLLNELVRLFDSPDRVNTIAADHDLRNQVLKSSLAKRTNTGKPTHPVDLEDVEISIDDVENVLEWSSAHVLGFFIRSLKKVVTLTQKNQADMEGLASFATGSPVSTSNTESSGPSESNPVDSEKSTGPIPSTT